MNRVRSILPIGMVNLLTGTSKEWGTIWEMWGEDASDHNMLVKNGEGKMKVIHTSGEGDKVGETFELQHDQTMVRYAGQWTVLATQPHTPAGLKALAEVAGKKCIATSTYK